MLWRIANAYSMYGILAVSDNYNMCLVYCINDTEMQIRVNSYTNYNIAEGRKYQDVAVANLNNQLGKEPSDPELLEDYLDWWFDDGKRMYGNYKGDILFVYHGYMSTHPEFKKIILEVLTPAQINELEKKRKDENYPLNLGEVP